MHFFLLLNTKEDILKNVGCWLRSKLLFFSIEWKSMVSSNCLVTHIPQNIFFYGQQKKEILRFGKT